MIEKTLSIIKPDGVARGLIGEVVGRFEKNKIRIAALKMVHLSIEDAKRFYAIHSERPFFDSLTKFEYWARRFTGIIFILVGIYYSLVYIFHLL